MAMPSDILTAPPLKVAVLIYKDAQVLDFAGPIEIFESASKEAATIFGREAPCYELSLLAEKKGPVSTSCGMKVHADVSFIDFDQPIDTVLISGGDGTPHALQNPKLMDAVKRLSQRAERITSVCSGSFFLAKAGFLDGKRATTHWAACNGFAKRYPQVQLEPDAIYVRDGNIWTSAGVTTGIDMALAMVAEDWGDDIALEIARQKVMYMVRPGGQSQFSTHLMAQRAQDPAIRKVTQWIVEHIDRPLTVPELARKSSLSERTFARRFSEELGLPPGKFIEHARLDAARHALERTRDPIDRVAFKSGFGSAERMRRVFHRHLSVSPQDYRERFRLI